MTNLPAPSWSRTNPNNRPTELYSPAMMHPQWATSVRHVTMERDAIPVVCAQETASGPKFACSLQLKPCSVFIVAAVPIPTAPSTSRTSNRGSCQTLVPSYSSHRGHPLALPVTVVPIPKAWFPPGNCTKQGPTLVPRWLSPLVVMVHYT